MTRVIGSFDALSASVREGSRASSTEVSPAATARSSDSTSMWVPRGRR